MKIELLPAARDDLTGIWLFGAERWSLEQADGYAHALMAAILRLADNPRIAPKVDDVRPGFRRLVSGAYAVFYRVEPKPC